MTGERSVDVAVGSGTLHVALLGGFSVRVGSRAVPGSWRLRKSKTLIKLLLSLAALQEALAAGLAGALLECRGPEEAVALVEPLVADRPHDEPLHRVLMEALDRAGRRRRSPSCSASPTAHGC